MTVLQPVQPYCPTFLKNLEKVMNAYVQKSVGDPGCTGCKIPGRVRRQRGWGMAM